MGRFFCMIGVHRWLHKHNPTVERYTSNANTVRSRKTDIVRPGGSGGLAKVGIRLSQTKVAGGRGAWGAGGSSRGKGCNTLPTMPAPSRRQQSKPADGWV